MSRHSFIFKTQPLWKLTTKLMGQFVLGHRVQNTVTATAAIMKCLEQMGIMSLNVASGITLQHSTPQGLLMSF